VANHALIGSAPHFLLGTISLASLPDLLYCPERAGNCPRAALMVTALDDIPAPAADRDA
jgi:hypothetical protein